MATPNVKNLPDPLYRRLLDRAKQQHRSVAAEVRHLLEQALEDTEPLSILELEGLGKHLWEGIDPAEYIEAERASWD